MKTKIKSASIFLASLILLSFFSSTVKAQSNKSSILWKITGNGLEKPSYLFGTIHIICPDDFIMNKKIEKSFNSTEQVILELDMDDPKMPAIMQQLSLNPGMKNFSEELSESDKKLLNEYYTKNFGMGLDKLGILKPMALNSMLYMKLLPCEKSKSYEQEFTNMAKTNDLEVKGLETVQEQMAIFDNIPQKEQIQWLVDMVKELDKSKQEFQDLIDVYKSKDVEKVYNFTKKFPEFSAYEESFLTNRNKKWIANMEEEMKQKSTFFAVGMAHLGSGTGVISLLKANGYTVKPIKI